MYDSIFEIDTLFFFSLSSLFSFFFFINKGSYIKYRTTSRWWLCVCASVSLCFCLCVCLLSLLSPNEKIDLRNIWTIFRLSKISQLELFCILYTSMSHTRLGIFPLAIHVALSKDSQLRQSRSSYTAKLIICHWLSFYRGLMYWAGTTKVSDNVKVWYFVRPVFTCGVWVTNESCGKKKVWNMKCVCACECVGWGGGSLSFSDCDSLLTERLYLGLLYV